MINYEDVVDGSICRVSKYRYVQSGKKVWFPLPEFPDHVRYTYTVYHFGTILSPEDFHFHKGKLFVHKYLPYRDHVYLTIREFQEPYKK